MAAVFSGPKHINVYPPRRQVSQLERPYPPDFVRRTILWLKSKFDDLAKSYFAGLQRRSETFHQKNRHWNISESTSFQARTHQPFQVDGFNWPLLFISCPPYQFLETLL